MGYPRRDYSENVTHHVISRCIEKRLLLKKSIVKKIFLVIVKKAQERYDFELNYYCIMDNHFHMIIRIVYNGDSLDKIMQYIKSNFARMYNKYTCRTGPFWNERYKTKIIEKYSNPEKYLLNTLLYLTINPVKANNVTSPFYYKYSSFLYYINNKVKLIVKITLHPFFLKLGKSIKECTNCFIDLFNYYKEKYIAHNWKLIYDFNYRN